MLLSARGSAPENVVAPQELERQRDTQLLSLFTLKESVWQAVMFLIYETIIFGNTLRKSDLGEAWRCCFIL